MRTIIALALAGFAGSLAAAAPDWQPIGENANGNKIFVDEAGIKTSGGITSVTFNCKDLTAAGVEVILFEDEPKNQAFARNKAGTIEYLKEPTGSSADLVVKHVCKK
jgi:hypothetical protein